MKLDEQEDKVFIKLNCHDCDKIDCGIAKKLVPFESKEGCTRKVSEETAARFHHYTEEVIPFWSEYNQQYVRQSYKEIIDFLEQEIYTAPIGQRLDPKGKVRLSGF